MKRKNLLHRVALFLLFLLVSASVSAQPLIPLYEPGHVPNAIPTTILNDSFMARLDDGRDTLIVVPRTR